MVDSTEKKAELDKDGIAYDFGKAELDRDGMSLSDESGIEEPVAGELPQQTTQETTKPRSKRNLALIISIISGFVVGIIVVSIVAYQLTKKTPADMGITYKKPTPPPGLDSPEGDIVLDPFMVLYNSRNPKDSGVLLTRISLQANRETVYNIGSRMFDIRNLIYQRLAANADIYSKEELAAIIRDDLKYINVNNVSFIEYEKK